MSEKIHTSTTETAQRLLDLLKHRRSFALKELTADVIDPSYIELMLEAANWAPSHGQTEPWRFTVFSGTGRAELGHAFAEAYQLITPPEKFDANGHKAQADRVWQASVWISLGLTPHPTANMPMWEEMSAVAAAVQNMHLMGSALNLACKWTSGAVVRHDSVTQFVGLQPPSQLLGFLYVGQPALAWPQGARQPVAEKVRWVR